MCTNPDNRTADDFFMTLIFNDLLMIASLTKFIEIPLFFL